LHRRYNWPQRHLSVDSSSGPFFEPDGSLGSLPIKGSSCRRMFYSNGHGLSEAMTARGHSRVSMTEHL
jgi:hypothetical protein